MAKEYMKRIEALRQQYLQTRVDMDVYDAAFFTEGFKEMEGQPWIIQRAKRLLQCMRQEKHLYPAS